MSYQDLDREIAHLEMVFGMIPNSRRIPLSYWRSRLRELSGSTLMPAQRVRVERLDGLLSALEEHQQALEADSPSRSTARRHTEGHAHGR